MVTLSVITAIIIISLIGFGVWKLQPGKRERNGYNTMPNSEYQQCVWVRIQILSMWIPGWIQVCDPGQNLMDLVFSTGADA
ncbi:hypothetical protein WISP_00455 [Willisornis vidua]|uniref:Uncharacterized protein n=1 Tax=Willisornis vidua TaxID=1566151 RepID=A0ABQ9DVK7_9PASS|nr:hypothetical protein WISP_00455 [Willisornis vidua]